jgi:hypothetical protein
MLVLPSAESRATDSSEDITPRSLLVRTHSPILCGSPLLRPLASLDESVQVATSPCCHQDLPDVISANLSLDTRVHIPAVPRSAFACFFLRVIGLPHICFGSASRLYPSKRFLDGRLSRLQPFLYVLVSKFARLSDRSHHRSSSLLGGRGFYPSRTCFVSSACIGYC